MGVLEIPPFAGLLLAWSLAAPPGPANALIAQESARRGYLSGILTGLGACTGDFVMFALMWFGVLRIVDAVPWLLPALGLVGAGLMLTFAFGAWRVARRHAPLEAAGRGSFWRSFVTVVTSPFNWAWWLSFGATLFHEMGEGSAFGFFLGLLLWVAFWAGVTHAGATRIRRFTEAIAYASAAVLVVFALMAFAYALTRGLELLARAG